MIAACLLLLVVAQRVYAESERYERVKTPYSGFVVKLIKKHWRYDFSNNEPGLVTELEIVISGQGRITGSRVVASSGDQAFDAAAMHAVEETVEVPAPLSGKPVTLYTTFSSPQIVSTGERSLARLTTVYTSLVTYAIQNSLRDVRLENADNLTSVLDLDIDAEGQIVGVQLAESSGCKEFDAAAVNAAHDTKLSLRPVRAQAIRIRVYIHAKRM